MCYTFAGINQNALSTPAHTHTHTHIQSIISYRLGWARRSVCEPAHSWLTHTHATKGGLKFPFNSNPHQPHDLHIVPSFSTICSISIFFLSLKSGCPSHSCHKQLESSSSLIREGTHAAEELFSCVLVHNRQFRRERASFEEKKKLHKTCAEQGFCGLALGRALHSPGLRRPLALIASQGTQKGHL